MAAAGAAAVAQPPHVSQPPKVEVIVVDRSVTFAGLRQQFHSRRTGPANEGDLTTPLTAGAPSGPAEPSSELRLGYMVLFDQIKESKGQILARLRTLSELHARPAVFGKEGRQHELAVEHITDELDDLFKKCKASIVVFERRSHPSTFTPTHQKIYDNMRSATVSDLSELSQIFREEQRRYLTERSRQKARAAQTSFGVNEDEAIYAAFKLQEQYIEKGLSDAEIKQLEDVEAEIASRDAELASIFRSVVKLNETMRDMNAMVIEQGTMVDRVDYNIQQAFGQVQSANAHLEGAERLQRRNPAGTAIIVLLILVFAAAVVFTFKMWLRFAR